MNLHDLWLFVYSAITAEYWRQKETDSIKQNEFYRPLGGMIEFGEPSSDALKREIMEETNQEITNLKYITTVENIFTYEGKAGHEIVMVYDAEFTDRSLYDKEDIDVTEGDVWCKAYWLSIKDCKSGKTILYPEEFWNIFDSICEEFQLVKYFFKFQKCNTKSGINTGFCMLKP